MKIKTKFKDLFLLKSLKYKDSRGYFNEIIKEKLIKKEISIFSNVFLEKNVIRGLHLQNKNSQGKFVTVIKGKIFDVAVDLRKNSKTYGKNFKCILSEENSTSIFIPPGFAHGFQALSNETYIIYSCTKYRDAKVKLL